MIKRVSAATIAFGMFALLLPACAIAADVLDAVTFGDPRSEQQHQLVPTRSETVTGALDLPARRLLPLDPPSGDGGKVAFTMKVDPRQPNYFTIKLSGDDRGEERGRLLLFCDGKQVGIRHIGDVDCLDILSNEPRYPGRFFYTTTTLPKAMTAGKDSVKLEVRSLGRIWGYGDTWDAFQKKLEQPSRGIYGVYTHTDPFFVPASDEKQGAAPAGETVRSEPGPEVMERLKERVNNQVNTVLTSPRIHQMQMQFLARAYHVKWTPAYHNAKVVEKLVNALDAVYVAYRSNPKLAQADPETYNAEWFGLGPSGDVIRLLAEPIKAYLDSPVGGVEGILRREGWAQMLVACRDWHREHRRLYTNQSMINDVYGIYLANRGVAVLDPSKALAEQEIRHYLYESVGLQPWLGSDTPQGPAKPLGENYLELTAKGLTKELGYVGSYGEVLDWVTSIYDATRPSVGEAGDEKIKAQLEKIARARATFRHPLVDADGNRAMVLETVVGWRDSHYPGDITYGQRTTWDAGPFETAAATLEPHLVGYAQQMLEDNQFFKAMQDRLKDGGFRVTAGLLGTPDAYELIKAQPPSPHRLPMTPTQPDFVFSDEEDGVVAIKNGDEILYASLYWRARFAVNSLARVHYLTPSVERDATVWEDVNFDDSGLTYTRDDRTIEAQTRRHEKSRGDVTQALEGETMPIAKVPPSTHYRPGDENVFAGKGTFYTLRYGPYLIGMNCTMDRTFELPPQQNGPAVAKELVSGKEVSVRSPITVKPRSTLVLWFGGKTN
jgi:hypothetical protein